MRKSKFVEWLKRRANNGNFEKWLIEISKENGCTRYRDFLEFFNQYCYFASKRRDTLEKQRKFYSDCTIRLCHLFDEYEMGRKS